MCQSTDCYNIDPGAQANYHNCRKIAFFPLTKWIITLECEILMIKKYFCETFTNRIIFSHFKRTIKNMYNKKKKKFDCKRKITFFYLKFSSNATLKNKNNDFLCQLHFLRLYHFWLMYFLFLLFVNTSHFHDLIRKKN